jgi:SAM-dependent methyltransferase
MLHWLNRAELPQHIRSFFRDARTYEAAHFIQKLIGKCSPVLCVGDEWGREYYALTAQGSVVFNLDIAWQPHLPRLTIGDVAHDIPFGDSTFDAVILAEVLEHLFDDARSLREARRVLKDDGLLVVSVPFFNDVPEYHVRLHSAKTVRRLLEHAGFQITRLVFRGGLLSFPRIVGLACRVFDRQTVLNQIAEWDWRWGARNNWWMRRSQYYGCYLAAKKSETKDFRALNRDQFSAAATLSRLQPPRG